MVEIEKLLVIEDENLLEEIVAFNREVFAELDASSPFRQSFPDHELRKMLVNDSIVKYVLFDEGKVIGLGILASDIGIDPYLSLPYFEKEYPGVELRYIPILAIGKDYRQGGNVRMLLMAMINEVPPRAVCILLAVEPQNAGIPLLVRHLGGDKVEGERLRGREVCYAFRWTNPDNAHI